MKVGYKREIFNFNHIDKSLKEDQINEKELYKYYHKRFWCFQKAHKQFKLPNPAINLSSTGLIVVGSIVGGVTLNPIVLGTISGSGVLVKTVAEAKNYKRRIEMGKFAFTTYQKTLIELRTALRGAEFDKENFITEMRLIDEIITDFLPPVCKYEKQYSREFLVE